MTLPHHDATREAVRREQLRMLWAHSRGGLVAATLFAGVLAVYAAGRVAVEWVAIWFAAKAVVAVIRAVQGWRFDRDGQPGDDSRRRWTHRLLAADGLVWGIGGIAMAATAPPDAATLSAAALIGVSCVATFGLQADKLATLCYVAPILVPSALGQFGRLDAQGLVMGLGLMAVLGLLLRTAKQSERRFAEMHELRLRADALAAERREALTLAQRESAAKSAFLSNVSHELRTPIHGVLGIARLLHIEVAGNALKRRVELIENSASHLLRLVNDLIDVARTHTDQLPLRPRRFDVVYELEALIGIYGIRAADKSVSFAAQMRITGPCWVVGDSARIRQILHNVLGNAIKYTDPHGAITVTARYQDEVLKFDCRDTGKGIAPQDHERIFAAFSRADGATEIEGAGLGLTIAREVARAMGGDITLQSAPGLGSVFTITLPLRSAAAMPAPEEDVAPAELRPVGPRHVLVAEDDDVAATIATAVLGNFGLRCERVTNGAEAVRHALRETERPDLVLMDCRMPTMDGFQATRAIRDQERALGLPRVPIIACTAEDSVTLRADCRAAGIDDVLGKPFQASELYSTLTRWLGGGMAPAELECWNADG